MSVIFNGISHKSEDFAISSPDMFLVGNNEEISLNHRYEEQKTHVPFERDNLYSRLFSLYLLQKLDYNFTIDYFFTDLLQKLD